MISTTSSPVTPYAVIERFRQDVCQVGIRFFDNNTNTPANLAGKQIRFQLLDNETPVVDVAMQADPQIANRLTTELSAETKQLLRKSRYAFRIFNVTANLTEVEGVFAWIKARPSRVAGPQVPPDLAVVYQSSTGLSDVMLVLQGLQGFKGWSALLANVQDGERVVQQIVGWTGGTGVAPSTGSYLGSNGLVTDIAQARNIRGRGFWPRGAWAATTAYAIDDIVTFQGSTYRRISAGNSGATFDSANWELWSRGLNLRGAWQANTVYADNDLVTFAGSTYRRLTAGTSGSTFAPAQWELWAQGVNFRGAWAATTAYAVNDIVTLQGSTYRCITAHTSGASITLANFEQWARGFNPRGAWAAATAYAVDDIVTLAGSTYRCITAHTSGSSIALANFEQWGRGFNPRGAWAATTAYAVDDLITYSGSTYRCATAHTSGATFSGTNWILWAAGLNYRGNWQPSTYYEAGDLIVARNTLYRANATHTSGTGSFTTANWTVVAAGLNNRGAWAATTAYEVNDFFTQAGTTYLVTAAFTSGAAFSVANTIVLAQGANISDDATLGGNAPSNTNGISQRVAKVIRDAMPNMHRVRVIENTMAWSEDFTNAVWSRTRASITTGAGLSPDGRNNASKLVEDTSNNTHQLARAVGPVVVAGLVYTGSIYLKAAERTFAQVILQNATQWGGSNPSIYINLTTGEVGGIGSSVLRYTVTDVGNGWWRVSLTASCTTSGNSGVGVNLSTGVFTNSFAGDGTSGILVWGGQFSQSEGPIEYVRTETFLISRSPVTVPDFRPLASLAGAENLLRYSGDLSFDVWTKVQMTVSLNNTAQPSGYNQAYKVVPTTSNVDHLVRQEFEYTAGQQYAFTVVARAAEWSVIKVCFNNTVMGVSSFANVDLTDGSFVSNGLDAVIVSSLGGGWWRITIVDTALYSVNDQFGAFFRVGPAPAASFSNTFAGDGTSGILVAAMQMNVGRYPTPYVRSFNSPVYSQRTVELGLKQDIARVNVLENWFTNSETATAGGRTGLSNQQIAGIVLPDGNTGQAWKLTEDTSTGTHGGSDIFAPNVVGPVNSQITISAYLRAAGRNRVRFGTSNNSLWANGNMIIDVDLQTGQIIGVSAFLAHYSITDVGNGWFRLSVTNVTASSNGSNLRPGIQIGLMDASGATSYAGDGTSGVYVWGGQISQTYGPIPYVRTGANSITKTVFEVKNDPAFASPSAVLPVSEQAVATALAGKRNAVNGVSTVTTAFQLATTDVGNTILVNSASNVVCTIPTHAVAAIGIGGMIRLIQQGTGLITFATTGITVLSTLSPVQSNGAGSVMVLEKLANNTWVISRI
ncbi:phage head spike fiber domain-containing protein [Tellurirhabdus rosea]|uniref:phage head spike fiber domain-containing protein n=1 Tax=Tellurirhabdus rosea TaxID=2674997 RepID=UPI00225959EF|nr:carbohydrate-binding protein [Tellurirhabdus rosea]